MDPSPQNGVTEHDDTMQLPHESSPEAIMASMPPSASLSPRTLSWTPTGTQSLRVLIVDDDPLIVDGTKALLEELGHRWTVAFSGQQALEVIESSHEVDLVITDQVMPKMVGTELIRQMLRVRPALKVVLATGFADSHSGLPSGIPCIHKPYRKENLERVISLVMSQ